MVNITMINSERSDILSVRIEVWGDYACFSRPELKTERVSYDVMTPSAARGIVEAILWHPGLRWHIDKIYVRAPMKNARGNAQKNKIFFYAISQRHLSKSIAEV